ncbi:hypothetical protein EELLY_v1c07080 [Entomoplasma ellychniae]|uniref:Uncharacterized protein n=1 Tax=Entomoplasma ellychniae TaxID=2114 RepID=A0A8E2R046_9MOLU|nr:hypothetical protein [Entomoplasma ellychniae]PPE05020.1 hypothetical protein EELLY_v1c07080 [Entomoplasma ellychniae]
MNKNFLLLHLFNYIALICWCFLLIILLIVVKSPYIYSLIIFIILSLISFVVFYSIDYKKKNFNFITLILFANSLNLIGLWVSFILIKKTSLGLKENNDHLKASWELKKIDLSTNEEITKELRELYDDYSLYVYKKVKNSSTYETNTHKIYEKAEKALLDNIFIIDYLKTNRLYSIGQIKQASKEELKIALKQVWKKT